jgi:hypothetical protein
MYGKLDFILLARRFAEKMKRATDKVKNEIEENLRVPSHYLDEYINYSYMCLEQFLREIRENYHSPYITQVSKLLNMLSNLP